MRKLEDELDITIYGIIFALLLIALLAAVNAIIYIPAISSWISDETGSSEATTYWASQATPFRIHSAAETPYSSPCGSASNGYVLELENSWVSTLSITSVSLDGEGGKFCNAALRRLGPVFVENGQRTLVGVEFARPVDCTPGEQKWVEVKIGYQREGGFDPPGVPRDGLQAGVKKLRVDCTNSTDEEPAGFHFSGSYLLPPLTTGAEYDYRFQASKGAEPYTYSTSDYLYGLKFESDGRLHGMPLPLDDLPYEILIKVKATDAQGSQAERAFRMAVNGKLPPQAPSNGSAAGAEGQNTAGEGGAEAQSGEQPPASGPLDLPQALPP